jgi:hypothetical protein
VKHAVGHVVKGFDGEGDFAFDGRGDGVAEEGLGETVE